MKRNLLAILLAISIVGIYSCTKDDEIISKITDVEIIGNDPIYAGDEIRVKWSSENASLLKIELWKPIESEWLVLENSVSALDTMATIIVPEDLLSSNEYKIKITELASMISAESSNFEIIGLQAHSESLSMGASYENDVYYSLSKGVIAEVSRTSWDVAFSVGAMSSSIIINEGAGVSLKVYPTTTGWNWADAIDTTGYSNWDALYNDDATWEEGAFGQNATGHPNYGWGVYNSTSHNVDGVAMYIIKLVNGDFKRIFVEIKDAAAKEYTFKYSDLNGANEVIETISFENVTSNFIYYSMVDESIIIDREPDPSTWDLLLTKWIDNSIFYPVTGVLQNIGIQAVAKTGVDVSTVAYNETELSDEITTIGADWKEFSMSTFQYVVAADQAFFVKNKDGKVFKIVFKTFEGSSTGNLSFDISPVIL